MCRNLSHYVIDKYLFTIPSIILAQSYFVPKTVSFETLGELNHMNMTSKILYIFWKLIGLCPFSLSENGIIQISYSGIFYSTILTLSYTMIYIRAMMNHSRLGKPCETTMSTIADIVAHSSEFWMIFVTWLCFGLCQDRIRRMQILLNEINESCDIFGIVIEYSNIIRTTKIQTVIVNFSFMMVIASGPLQRSTSAWFELSVWVPFSVVRIVYPNFTILFIAAMSAIRSRFQSLNEKIKQLTTSNIKILTIQKLENARRNELGM